MSESLFVEKGTSDLLVPSAAGFSPSGNQIGLVSATPLEMMVQVFQDDADWTVTSNILLTANRTGRYRFSGMWTFDRTAGTDTESFSVDLRQDSVEIQKRAIAYPIALTPNRVSACMVITALITEGETLETRAIIALNTYQMVAAESSLLIERMRT